MAEGKKRFYRLFKVAKELNVASGTLVDHLGGEGFEIDDSPNTKLTSDQYEILLKTFASDKVVKEKAEQLSERRKEDSRSGRPNGEDGVSQEEENEHLSASQLRNKILPKRKRRRSSGSGGSSGSERVGIVTPDSQSKVVPAESKSEQPNEEKGKKEPKPHIVENTNTELETNKEVKPNKDIGSSSLIKEGKKEDSEKGEENGSIKLKVVGKIDLDTFKSKKQPNTDTNLQNKKNTQPTSSKGKTEIVNKINQSDNKLKQDSKQSKLPDRKVEPSRESISQNNIQNEKVSPISSEKDQETTSLSSDKKIEKPESTQSENDTSTLSQRVESIENKSISTEANQVKVGNKPEKREAGEKKKEYQKKNTTQKREPSTSSSRISELNRKKEGITSKQSDSHGSKENKTVSKDFSNSKEKTIKTPQLPVSEKLPSTTNDTDNVNGDEEDEDIMRATDRTPNLKGLKVLGKIELPGSRKGRKKKEKSSKDSSKSENKKGTTERSRTKASESTSPEKKVGPKQNENKTDEGDAGDASKKKRRRRRKRKRKPSGETTTASSPNNKDATKGNKSSNGSQSQGGSRSSRRGRKEKPSQKEVEESIKTTFSQMGKGASRRRQQLRRAKRDEVAAKREQEAIEQEKASKVLDVTEFITANEFADMLSVQVNEIIKKSFELGIMVSINQRLDAELLSIIAEEYGYRVNFVDITDREFEFDEDEDDGDNKEARSPIITVMGHVDHGKTTLLDHLRKTNVTASEAGGITQHIGAYVVKLGSENTVTFLDTPGHEAFTAMRARGAKATDVVIIVIAADDAVMPQTVEAINHAQAADVPIVFAINKIDKDGADPEKIKGQLAEMNFLVEDWGGNYQCQEISALKGEGVDELLEKVILEADLLELKANTQKSATGTVIEARLDKGRGNVATVLVQNGTLIVGDAMVAGVHFGKVRALINQNGERVKKAEPSVPVQVLGLGGQPQAGDKFKIFEDEGKAKDISQRRQELFREQQLRQTKRITLEEIGRRRAIGNFEELNIIIKGDVDGSVEALAGSLLKLSTDEVQVNILLKGVGAITEGDVLLSSASDAVIIAFNVRPNAQAKNLADREEIDIRTYSVIYDAINDVKDALEGLLSPELKEEIQGIAEVRDVFKISRVGTVAGCYVTSGKIYRSNPIRVIRDGVVIYDSTIASLKRFKDDVKEVAFGYECGIMVENYQDIKVGDILESYLVNEIKRKL